MESKYHKKPEEIEDELLWINKSKEDPRHFATLYEKYYKVIFLYIYRKVTDMDVAGDLTSEVFSKALATIKTYEFKGVPYSAWLYRIASNEANMHFRKTNKREVICIDENGIHLLKTDLEEPVEEDEYLKLLPRCMERLKAEEVQLVQWRFFENKAFKEVGEIMNMTENNAKVKTYRILEKVRKWMLEMKGKDHE
ncbi:MAG: sigma-70 family RNA polymerase sigma factor [Cytophagales bacterium]|nr:sigma-70 family RNA polymerase sigma factor [Cytophaga sp.]